MSEPKTYYNSTALTTPELFEAIKLATIQNDRVMLIFKAKARPMSPSEVWQVYQAWFQGRIPLTSIRRSITVLNTNIVDYQYNIKVKAKLAKTGEYKIGIYGRREQLWEIAQ